MECHGQVTGHMKVRADLMPLPPLNRLPKDVLRGEVGMLGSPDVSLSAAADASPSTAGGSAHHVSRFAENGTPEHAP